jgi:primosomal protein DnaI
MQQLKFNQNTKANREILKKKTSITDELLTKKEIKDIIKKLNVGMEEFDYYLGYFLSYYEDRACCKKCQNLDKCEKEIKGTVLKLVRQDDNSLEREYTLCPKREEQRKIKNNYLIRDFNEELLNIDIDNMENKKGRFEYEKKIIGIDSANASEGMFISGPSSSGKSYPLIALCNEFVKENKTCAFVDVKTFIESLKNTFGDNKENTKLMDIVKSVDVLVLDNLGEEKQSEWVRDDVVSTIIDYRLKNNSLTFITSCYTLGELEKMYNVSKTNSEMGKIKASKFIDKIKSICPNIINIEK